MHAAFDWMTRAYTLPPASAVLVLAAGALLGAAGDVLFRAPGPPGLNLSIWIAGVAAAALVLHRRSNLVPDHNRTAWLAIGTAFAAGLSWRDAPALKLLGLGCATVTFALAAYRPGGGWVRRAGIVRYALALALGALHAWTAAALAILDAARWSSPTRAEGAAGWRGGAAVARGLLVAAPLVAVFGALFMSADAVFEALVTSVFRFDVEWLLGHVLLFSVLAWLAAGYLHGFLTGTALPLLSDSLDRSGPGAVTARGPAGTTEVITALSAVALLFLLFVAVQSRYLFGADTLVQVTPGLTYADFARRGFFELVFASVLVVPLLLVADWVTGERGGRAAWVFRSVAGLQIVLVLAVAASALHRLRLYYESYGLTASRLYALVLLVWIAAMLCWLAATVLRGRRERFAFGALTSGLATIALLFAVNPDAVVARTNVARMASAGTPERFDVAYATTLSADAVPILLEAMPGLPADLRCPLARHMLRRWPPGRPPSLRGWSWSAARAAGAVRAAETQLRSMVLPDGQCAPRQALFPVAEEIGKRQRPAEALVQPPDTSAQVIVGHHVGRGGDNHFVVGRRGGVDRDVAEGGRNGGNVVGHAVVLVHVERHDPAGGERLLQAIEERQGLEARGDTGRVGVARRPEERVHEDQVVAVLGGLDEGHRVGGVDADVLPRADAEVFPGEPDDNGIDLDGVDLHPRLVVAQEVHHRSAAQADDEHAARIGLIQVAREHAAGVRRYQGVRGAQVDAALHGLLAVVSDKGQRPHVAVAADANARERRHLLVLQAPQRPFRGDRPDDERDGGGK